MSLQELAAHRSYTDVLLMIQMMLEDRKDIKSIALSKFLDCELYKELSNAKNKEQLS
jgi:hypothetical protein